MQGYLASSKGFQLAEGSPGSPDPPRARIRRSLPRTRRTSRRLITLAGISTAGRRSRSRIGAHSVSRRDPRRAEIPRGSYIYLRGEIETIGLTTRIEQARTPTAASSPSAERDQLGMQRVALDWRLSDVDRENVGRTLELLRSRGRRRQHRARGSSTARTRQAGRRPRRGQHHMGTTRMSDDPRQGVVRPRLPRAHGLQLFVAGSSVFPARRGTPTLLSRCARSGSPIASRA